MHRPDLHIVGQQGYCIGLSIGHCNGLVAPREACPERSPAILSYYQARVVLADQQLTAAERSNAGAARLEKLSKYPSIGIQQDKPVQTTRLCQLCTDEDSA